MQIKNLVVIHRRQLCIALYTRVSQQRDEMGRTSHFMKSVELWNSSHTKDAFEIRWGREFLKSNPEQTDD